MNSYRQEFALGGIFVTAVNVSTLKPHNVNMSSRKPRSRPAKVVGDNQVWYVMK